MKRPLCYLILLLLGLGVGIQAEASQSSGQGKADIGFIQGNQTPSTPGPKPEQPPKKILSLPQTGEKSSVDGLAIGGLLIVIVGLAVSKKHTENKVS